MQHTEYHISRSKHLDYPPACVSKHSGRLFHPATPPRPHNMLLATQVTRDEWWITLLQEPVVARRRLAMVQECCSLSPTSYTARFAASNCPPRASTLPEFVISPRTRKLRPRARRCSNCPCGKRLTHLAFFMHAFQSHVSAS
jgi:hypothetical protein